MRVHSTTGALTSALALLSQTQAASVKGQQAAAAADKRVQIFYLLGGNNETNSFRDVDKAKELGVDAFTLNIFEPHGLYVPRPLAALFKRAEQVGFKLSVNMDLDAVGRTCKSTGKYCGGPNEYDAIFDKYLGSPAYLRDSQGRAFISSYTTGNNTPAAFKAWRSKLEKKHGPILFVPSFDDTAGYYDASGPPAKFWKDWADVVDGLHSWDTAWAPMGSSKYPGSIDRDEPVSAAARAHGKGYSVGVAPVQYRNSYHLRLYRQGLNSLPYKMVNILANPSLANDVRLNTWNDFPACDDLGYSYVEQNTDKEPNAYAGPVYGKWDHTAWQPLVAAFVPAFKQGLDRTQVSPADGGTVTGASWHHVVLPGAVCGHEALDETYTKVPGWADMDYKLNWAIVLKPGSGTGYQAVLSAGGVNQTVALAPGLNYGSSQVDYKVGPQTVRVLDPSGRVLKTSTSKYCVSATCPRGIYNGNYQVNGFVDGDVAPHCQELDG